MRQRAIALFFSIVATLVLPACATLAGHPLTYSAEAIEGWVVDAETKKPLAGVVVTANWQLTNQFANQVGQMMVYETVTDQNGRYYFPAWGPKLAPPNAILKFADPQIVMFKSGYDFERLTNPVVSEIPKHSLRKSVWNGKTIALKPFRDRPVAWDSHTSEYAWRLGFIVSSFSWAYSDDICELKRIPRMAVALHLQERKFKERGIYSTLPSVDYILDKEWPDPCGLQRVLLSHMP